MIIGISLFFAIYSAIGLMAGRMFCGKWKHGPHKVRDGRGCIVVWCDGNGTHLAFGGDRFAKYHLLGESIHKLRNTT